MGDKTDPCPIPTLMLKNGEENFFQKYQVFLPTR